MALMHSLMRFKEELKIASFEMHGDKKATISLLNGKGLTVFMADQYIVGIADVAEAVEEPAASCLIYNAWDSIGKSAEVEALRRGIKVYKFGAFGHFLDELNAN